MFTAESADSLLAGSLDYVIDAIDNIDTKVSRIAFSLMLRAAHGQQQTKQ